MVKTRTRNKQNENVASNTKSSTSAISKYFVKNTKDDEDEPNQSVYNFRKTRQSKENSSQVKFCDDDSDFKSPQLPKLPAKLCDFEFVKKKPLRKFVKLPKAPPKSTLRKEIEENVEDDVNGEHLQLALALSKSAHNARLEAFGFKICNKDDIVIPARAPQPVKKKKKSKFDYLTPTLLMRTNEERKQIIESKVSQIIIESTESSQLDKITTPVETVSYKLHDFLCHEKCSFKKAALTEKHWKTYYISNWESVEVINPLKCGSFLKNWHKIVGRERTPEKTPKKVTLEMKKQEKSNHSITSLSVANKSKSPEKEIEMLVENKDGFLNNSLNEENIAKIISRKNSESPDLFLSDEDSDLDVLNNPIKSIDLSNLSEDQLSFQVGDNGICSYESYKELQENNCENNSVETLPDEDLKDSCGENNKLAEIDLSKTPDEFDKQNETNSFANITDFINNLLENAEQKENNGINLSKQSEECSGNSQIKEIATTSTNLELKENNEKIIESNVIDLSQDSDENSMDSEIKESHKNSLKNCDLSMNCLNVSNIFTENIDSSDRLNLESKPFSKTPRKNNEEVINSTPECINTSYDYLDQLYNPYYEINTTTGCTNKETDNLSDEISISQISYKEEEEAKSPQKRNDLSTSIEISDEELNYSCRDYKEERKISYIKNSPNNKSIDVEDLLEKLEDKDLKDESISDAETVDLSQNEKNEDIYKENNELIEIEHDFIIQTESIQEEFNESFQTIETPKTNCFPNSSSKPIHPRVKELQAVKYNNQNEETPPKQNKVDESVLINFTPDERVVIKTKDITPMADYSKMSTPQIRKELEKFGLRNLKRHRGVQILEHIYNTTHPKVSSEVNDEDAECSATVPKRRKKLDFQKCSETPEKGGNSNNDVKNRCFAKFDSIALSEPLESMIFETKTSKKISSCRVPFHIVWFNFLMENPEIRKKVLLYEPLQVKTLDRMFKDSGYNFHINDIISFLDRKCITIAIQQKPTKSTKN